MTTTRQPLVAHVRTWLDFDQKFLAVFVVFVAVAILDGFRLALGQISVLEAGAEVGPLFLAAASAYIATSTHREDIEKVGAQVANVVNEAAPLLEATEPAAVPIVNDLQAALKTLGLDQSSASTSLSPATVSVAVQTPAAPAAATE